MLKGIDVSKWNGKINWAKVKNTGTQFSILKIIDKSCNAEPSFEDNYIGSIENKIPIGVYNYSYATTMEKAIDDAEKVVEILDGRAVPCKVWLDIEDKCQKNLGITLIDIINVYQEVIEYAGYEFGVYTGLAFYNYYIKPYANNVNCQFWIARYPSINEMELNNNPRLSKKPEIAHPLWGWQYSQYGQMEGINGNVDFNIMYAEIENNIALPGNPYNEPTYNLYKGKSSMAKEYVKWLQIGRAHV